ncbi:MAG: hypothetical protein ACRDPY_46280, partial [Streptosporangiaceae bacterium]
PMMQSSPSGPALQVEDVEIALTSNIDATVQNPAEQPLRSKTAGSAIDITLRNSGDEPALIVDAVFSFTRNTELVNCFGAGPGSATAEYDVKVPPEAATSSDPLVVKRDMRFIVDANSIDRFRISVGPSSYYLAGWPWVYEFDLTLDEDNGQRIDLGRMSILGLTGSSWNELGDGTATAFLKQNKSCVAQDASALSQAMTSPGLHSPELRTMYREAESLIKNSPACQSPSSTQNTDGCPASGTTFFSDPRGVTICSSTMEVVQSYNCGAGENVAREYEKANGSMTMTVSMTFTSGLLVLPMRCQPSGQAEVCRSTDDQALVVGFIP